MHPSKSNTKRKQVTKSICALLLIMSLISLPKTVTAQTFTVVNILDFGEAIDRGSTSRSRVTINPDGSFIADPAYIFITTPTPGHITFTGAPPNTNFTVNVALNFNINGPSGSRFRINNQTVGPTVLLTDAFGDGEFFIGARANTRRQGPGPYPDGAHTGNFEATVTFLP